MINFFMYMNYIKMVIYSTCCLLLGNGMLTLKTGGQYVGAWSNDKRNGKNL